MNKEQEGMNEKEAFKLFKKKSELMRQKEDMHAEQVGDYMRFIAQYFPHYSQDNDARELVIDVNTFILNQLLYREPRIASLIQEGYAGVGIHIDPEELVDGYDLMQRLAHYDLNRIRDMHCMSAVEKIDYASVHSLTRECWNGRNPTDLEWLKIPLEMLGEYVHYSKEAFYQDAERRLTKALGKYLHPRRHDIVESIQALQTTWQSMFADFDRPFELQDAV